MYEYKGDGNKIGIWCEDHICHDNSMYDATRYGQRVLVNIGGLGGYILCHAHINNYIHYTVWDVITFLPYPAVPDDGSTVQGVVPYGTIGMPKNLYNNDGDS